MNKLRFRTKSLGVTYIRFRTNINWVDFVNVQSWELTSYGSGLNHFG